MHSSIFQLSIYPIDKSQWLHDDSISKGADVLQDIDYVDAYDEEKRKEAIKNLATQTLPQFFELNRDLSLTYKGGAEEYKKKFVTQLQKLASSVNEENLSEYIGPTWQLQKFLSNPLNIGTLFVTDWNESVGLGCSSAEFMVFLMKLKPGDKLYIGQVFDYHW